MVCALLFTMSQGLGVPLKWGALRTLTRPATIQPAGQSHPVASEEGLVWRRGKQVSFFWVEDGQGWGAEPPAGEAPRGGCLSRVRSRHPVRMWPRVPTARPGWLGGHLSGRLPPFSCERQAGRDRGLGAICWGSSLCETRVPPHGWRVEGKPTEGAFRAEGGSAGQACSVTICARPSWTAWARPP